jgi:two-component system, chemotaxis family, chemotaxis protein CheY
MPDLNADALVILLIEDEAHIRRIVRQILFRIGVRNVYEAADGGDGFMQVLRVKPHVVLCDIHMAPVDGITFLETLRAAKVDKVRSTPVLFLTSNAKEETIMRARDLRVNGYMVKPVSVNDVKRNLERVLGGNIV